MEKANQSSDSFDSMLVGHSRRIPLPLPHFQPNADLNEVEIELPKEEVISSDRVPVKQERTAGIVKRRTHMKVFLFLYFTCCFCVCRKGKSTTIVPTVANKYIVAE